jgi:hypothetical protein
MTFLAIFNALIREYTYGKFLSDLHSHQISSFTAIILLGSYIGLISYFFPIEFPLQALTIGLVWLALTITFEFLFGHYVAGHSWVKLLEDYNVLAGRLWVVVLIWITLAPLIFYQLWK